mgnify:FL=1
MSNIQLRKKSTGYYKFYDYDIAYMSPDNCQPFWGVFVDNEMIEGFSTLREVRKYLLGQIQKTQRKNMVQMKAKVELIIDNDYLIRERANPRMSDYQMIDYAKAELEYKIREAIRHGELHSIISITWEKEK